MGTYKVFIQYGHIQGVHSIWAHTRYSFNMDTFNMETYYVFSNMDRNKENIQYLK